MSHCSFRNIPRTSLAEDNVKLMSAVGHAGGFFYTARKGHLLPLLADKAKQERPHQPGLKASKSLPSGLLMTST